MVLESTNTGCCLADSRYFCKHSLGLLPLSSLRLLRKRRSLTFFFWFFVRRSAGGGVAGGASGGQWMEGLASSSMWSSSSAKVSALAIASRVLNPTGHWMGSPQAGGNLWPDCALHPA